jgi:hypothetical protein
MGTEFNVDYDSVNLLASRRSLAATVLRQVPLVLGTCLLQSRLSSVLLATEQLKSEPEEVPARSASFATAWETPSTAALYS